MDKKMNVLDVRLDNYTAKDAMKQVAEFLKTEPVNTVEIITVDSLMCASQAEDLKADIGKLDLVIAGDAAILEAAEVSEKKKLQEAQDQVFLKMLFRYFHKNGLKMFILTDTEEEGQMLRHYIEEKHAGIVPAGFAVVPGDESADDQIINSINGTEADLVLAYMSSPGQEQFIGRVKHALSVRLWLGIGKAQLASAGTPGWKVRLQDFIERRMMKREAQKEKKKKEI